MRDIFAKGEKLYARLMEPIEEKYGLTAMELTLLLFLANHPGADTAAEAVRCRRLSKSHVSVSVRALRERGLLEGAYRGRDQRTIHLSLTPAAAEMVREGQGAQEHFSELLLRGFSAGERQQLASFMERIDGNIERESGQTEPEGENHGKQ